MTDPARIREFWSWFAGACATFGERFENAAAVEELARRIAGLGPYSWELGPGRKDSSQLLLVVSPGGNPELLPETRDIIALAPICPGWEFAPARPPKQWDLRASLDYEGMGTLFLDARSWRYVLQKRPDGMFRIVICAPEIADYDDSVKQVAAGIILDGELGEEARLDDIDEIQVVAEFDETLSEGAAPLAVLKDEWAGRTGS